LSACPAGRSAWTDGRRAVLALSAWPADRSAWTDGRRA